MSSTQLAQAQALFEKHCSATYGYFDFKKDQVGDYLEQDMQNMWEIWIAANDTLAVVAEPDAYMFTVCHVDSKKVSTLAALDYHLDFKEKLLTKEPLFLATSLATASPVLVPIDLLNEVIAYLRESATSTPPIRLRHIH